MFEKDGDELGETELWENRLELNQRLPFPAGRSDILTDGKGVICITTAMGVSNAAASVMALGLDPRFDFTKAYWLVAGISGIDPNDGSMGSAVWTRFVVDGGLAHEIDAREIPADWSTGYLPLRSAKPFDRNGQPVNPSQFFQLNEGLLQWAYQLTKDTPSLTDRIWPNGGRNLSGFPMHKSPPSF